jgi:heterodisulfide reductase subunit A
VIDDVYEAGLGYRKAVYTPFPQAVPKYPVIDVANCTYFRKGTCRACEKLCPTGAIDFTQKDEELTVEVGNIILATGYDLFDPQRVTQYGYGRLANVFTSLEFERLTNAAGPTNGAIVLRDGKTVPKSVGILHCVGSRDRNFNNYCSVDLLHAEPEVRASGQGAHRRDGLQLLHRHPNDGQGLRRVLSARARGRARSSSAAGWPR